MSKYEYHISLISDGNMSFKYGEEEEVTNNRKKFLAKYKIGLENCVTTYLHGEDQVQVVSLSDRGKLFEVDALITADRGVGLFICAADCFPVVVYDPSHHVLALVHLGRSGIGKKLIQKVINIMSSQFQSLPEELEISIGAGIRKNSYLYDKAPDSDPAWKPYLEKTADEQIAIDMTSYLMAQLIESGIQNKNINDSGIDTFADKNYFSHRRSVVTGEPDGRFGVVAILI